MSERESKRCAYRREPEPVVVYIAETFNGHAEVMTLLSDAGLNPFSLDPVPQHTQHLGLPALRLAKLNVRIAVPADFADDAHALLAERSSRTVSRADEIEHKAVHDMMWAIIPAAIVGLLVSLYSIFHGILAAAAAFVLILNKKRIHDLLDKRPKSDEPDERE